MNKLALRGITVGLESARVGRISHGLLADNLERKDQILVLPSHMVDQIEPERLSGYAALLSKEAPSQTLPHAQVLPPLIHSLPDTDQLCEGDVVVLRPDRGPGQTAAVRVIYCRNSRFCNLLLTEQCNSRCLMCSQPPKEADDSYLVDEALQVIRLIDKNAPVLGITGGEPTLLKDDFLTIVRACKEELPDTHLHVLTNGRMFIYKGFCKKLTDIKHQNLMLGIPLYSDLASEHDYVVQAMGAFDQTLAGLYNLATFGLGIEIRVVVHALTYKRLPQLARFIASNLPFVAHVALMGLEITGYTKMNLKEIWVDPFDYQQELGEAVSFLASRGMRVSIYNHQLCLLPISLWPYARKAISDWKNIYLDECQCCSVLDRCGGLFKSQETVHSAHIKGLVEDPSLVGV